MRIQLILIVLLLGLFTASAYAQEEEKFLVPPAPDFSELVMTGEAQVDTVIDPLRVRLLDGRIVQLAGVGIPDLTPHDTGDIGMAALEALRETLDKKHVKIYQSKDVEKARLNRMGFHLAHLAEKNSGMWVQGALVLNGLARVRPSELNPDMAEPMLTLEEQAREASRGLWADQKYAVLSPETASTGLHHWAIIEGTVHGSAMAGNTIYLNFGPDWRTDFTVGIKPEVRRELAKLGIDPLQFANKHVRVRGWLESYNGPYIELMHPVWIEALPAEGEAATLEGNN